VNYSGELADFPEFYLTYSVEQEALMTKIIISVSIGVVLVTAIILYFRGKKYKQKIKTHKT